MMIRRLWLTGYRNYELNIYQEKDPKLQVIKYSLRKALIPYLDDGLEWIITGAQLGTEQWGLQVIDELKKEYSQLRVALMLPFQDFGNQWNEQHQATFNLLKEQADFIGQVSKQPYQNPSQLKNYQHFMGEHTDGALLVYDPEAPGKTQYDYDYIKKVLTPKDYPLQLIDMYELQDDAQSWSELQAEHSETSEN